MNKTMKKLSILLIAVLLLGTVSAKVLAYDGTVNQGMDYSNYSSMYLYTIEMTLSNPCNSKSMDKDAIYQLWFDFEFAGENGYGQSGTYRLDMSWKNGRNLNSEIVTPTFIRPNDNSCHTSMQVWVPGLVKKVKVHLNMDGFERLTFYIDEIKLNGYRINTNRNYVTSFTGDSDTTIYCRVPSSRIAVGVPVDDPEALPKSCRDQYGGLVDLGFVEKAKSLLYQGNKDSFYHSK